MPRVVHFEVPADDPGRAIQFYSRVFGWSVNKWQGPMDYWLIQSGQADEPGIDGAIARRQEPVTSVVNTIDVPSVDECVNRVVANDGKVIVPKRAVPGVGYLAYCRDTEGNLFGLMQSDESAA